MDFFNRAVDQIKDLFASMTPGARITAGLLLVVIVVSLAFLFQGGVAKSDGYLLGGRPFSSAELEAMEGAFAKAGLSNYTIESNRVRIPDASKADYVAALAENQALPANFSDYFASMAKGASVFETKEQAALRWRLAKQQELSLIISSMQGVSRAQVIYDEVEKAGFPRRVEKTATVAAQATGTTELAPHQVKAIRTLVASAIAGMDSQNVSVTDLNTNKTYGGSSGDMASADEDPHIERKRAYESDWRQKLQNALTFVPGVVVAVDVELSKETSLHEEAVSIDNKPVIVRTTVHEKSSTNSRGGPSGRPGAASQQNGLANQGTTIGTAGGGESTTDESTENVERIGGHERVVRSTAPLVPTKVTAAIGVPSSYYVQIWKERNPDAAVDPAKQPDEVALRAIEGEVTKKIQEMVVNLLPKMPPGEDKYPLISVQTFDHLSPPEMTEPSLAHTATVWLADNWNAVGVLLVGAFGLVMLRGMLKARPAPPPSADRPAALSLVSGDDDDEDEQEEGSRGFSNTGANIREELAGMVRENPEAAANILRTWIGEAG
ncbi:MAG: hypothetical protein KDA41_14145 [Planctomycetales bacterium]|nr:hypothetical protein [Planctomycetales bacterium]